MQTGQAKIAGSLFGSLLKAYINYTDIFIKCTTLLNVILQEHLRLYMYHLYQVSINRIEINTSVEKYFSITPILLENDSGLLLQFLFSLKITIKLQFWLAFPRLYKDRTHLKRQYSCAAWKTFIDEFFLFFFSINKYLHQH